ncbi:MAG: DUF1549 and DUF1553 domain-containing protein [Pirellulaceae bacterium]
MSSSMHEKRIHMVPFLLAAFLSFGLGGGSGELRGAEADDEIQESPISRYDRDHWSFKPIESPEIPDVQDAQWCRTEIDRFILSRIEAAFLSPAATTDRATYLRRVSFDLHGLPPTTRQLDAFMKDQRPDAYERLVDRLLASPQYGRHWGQYWLDLARFADTDGFEHDKVRDNAWKYRDWVIDAFNSDLPLDEFIVCQLAGDVVSANDPQGAIPTAFCLSGPDMPDINSQEERKHMLLNETTATVGSVFLSLQFGCAQCHDHKYDAISQADFYRLRAFFDPAVKLKRNGPVSVLSSDADPGADSRFYQRGDWRSPGPILEAGFPRVVNVTDAPVVADEPGRKRLALARWLTATENPLTSRSLVNRIWQFHFGRGLSSTPSDFGVMGEEPTHPELLDFLAKQLVSQSWSLKKLHRQIVLSSVYRTDSRYVDRSGQGQMQTDGAWRQLMQADPDNHLLARFPRRRLRAEVIRDAILTASGQINHASGGPGVRPPLPKELLQTLLPGQWTQSAAEADHHRRSIYLFARRNMRYPLLAIFDRPTADCSCAARQPSTTAIQSLALFNSDFTLAQSVELARLVEAMELSQDDQIRELYRRLFCRHPTTEELRDASEFLQQQMAGSTGLDAQRQALTDLCRAMFNSNPFLYVD